MYNRTVATSGTYVRANAPGASSIEIEVQMPSPAYGNGYGYYDPLVQARRTFFGWLCVAIVFTAFSLTWNRLFLMPLPVLAFIIARASYTHFCWMHGVRGLTAFVDFIVSPGEWWLTDPNDVVVPATSGPASTKTNRAPLSYRVARIREFVGNTWFKARQLPRRAYCAVAGRQPQPAPVGTLRLTHEKRETLAGLGVGRKRPK